MFTTGRTAVEFRNLLSLGRAPAARAQFGRRRGILVLLAVVLLAATWGSAFHPQQALAQASELLPAPFYFIDGYSGQVVRIAADGVTRRTITHETSSVTALDVSPDGSRIVYVAGNRLIEMDADGLNPVVKLDGEAAAGEFANALRIDAPVYSPDGARIAFVRGGINLIAAGPEAAGEETVTLVLADGALPANGEAPAAEPVRFFRPHSWSPDGVHLLLDFSYYPEGSGLAILAPDANVLVDVTPDPNAEDPGAIPLFGDVAWKLDSTGFFVASAAVYYGAPGLSWVDAGSGVATGILTTSTAEPVSEEAPLIAVRGPRWTTGGALRAYVAEQTAMDAPLETAAYRLEEIDPANGQRTPLNDQTYGLVEGAVWAPDDSGALLLSDGQSTVAGTNSSLNWGPVSDPAGDAAGDLLAWLAFGRAAQWGTNDFGHAPAQEQEVVALFDAAIDLAGVQAGQDPPPFGPSAAFPVQVAGGDGAAYWVVHTTGTRSFTPDRPHALAVYRQSGGEWQEASVVELGGALEGMTAGPDYLPEGGVQPLRIGAPGGTANDGTQLWLQVEGGAGAHSGVCEILRLVEDELRTELDGFSASPGACTVEDVNGDGINEVVLDATDYYVFCYACGVRFVDYAVERWTGQAFEPLTLQPLPAAAPAALVATNDELLRLVQGGLWKAALALVEGSAAASETEAAGEPAMAGVAGNALGATAAVTRTAPGETAPDEAGPTATKPAETGAVETGAAAQTVAAVSDPSGVYQWNTALVRLIGEERRAETEAPDHPYPLLAQVFYGDYPAAVDVMRTYTVTEVFAQPSALISGTVAQGWDDSLAGWLTRNASSAIGVNPQLAAAYFVRGYGTWLGGAATAAAAAAEDVPPADVVAVVPAAELGIDPAIIDAAVADMRQALDLSPDVGQTAYYAAALALLTGEEVAMPSAPGPGNTAGLTGTPGVTGTTGMTGTAGVSATPTITGAVDAASQGQLLYSTAVDGEDRIFLLAFGAANATLVEVLGQARQASLQPGGVRLAYQSTRPDMLGLGGYDLTADAEVAARAGLAQDPNAAGRFNFTTNAEDSLPRWNLEGNRLAFSSTRYGDGRSRVYVVWADGVSEASDLGEGSDPDWSPDGTRLVYRGCDETGAQCGLWTLALVEGGATDRRPLTDNAGDMRPRWSPDGSRVVFMSDGRDGNYDVYSVGVNADFGPGEVVRITFNAASDGLPAVSPDGREIVFVSNRGNRWGIWRVAIESGQARSVVGELGAVTDWLDQGVDWVR